MPPPLYLDIEVRIARAHRALWGAKHLAEHMELDGLSADLQQLLDELARLQVNMLRGPATLKLSKRAPAQLKLHQNQP